MRLTNFIRVAFVRAAMADVPTVPYQQQAETIARDFIKSEFARVFPKIDMDGEAATWLGKTGVDLPGSLSNIYVSCPSYRYLRDREIWQELTEIARLHREQELQLQHLKNHLQGVAMACSTRKQLLDALPEFESYLPAEEAKVAKNLPAVTNVLSDFVKAGWPKNQPKMPKAIA